MKDQWRKAVCAALAACMLLLSAGCTPEPELSVHEHPLNHYEAVEPTCIRRGNIEYWICPVCGLIFSDPLGLNTISYEETFLFGQHRFREWHSANALEHRRQCAVCGIAERKTHEVSAGTCPLCSVEFLTDTQLIPNGNFEFYSEMYAAGAEDKLAFIDAPYGWSFTAGSPSSEAKSGIVDALDWEDFTNSKTELTSVAEALAHWTDGSTTLYDRLKFYDMFDGRLEREFRLYDSYGYQISCRDIEDFSAVGKTLLLHDDERQRAEGDTSILMIHNRRVSDGVLGTGQSFTSDSQMILNAGTAATFSVWVRTDDLHHYYADNEETAVKGNAGAYVRIGQSAGGVALDPVYLENINTRGKWMQYTFWICAPSQHSVAVTLTLGLGQGDPDQRLYYVNGFAFFDDLIWENASYDQFDSTESDGEYCPGGETRFEGKDHSVIKIDLR